MDKPAESYEAYKKQRSSGAPQTTPKSRANLGKLVVPQVASF
jgi:hypothetical protein